MRVPPTSRRHLGEERRYFPDWIERLLENEIELEADRNSYLACGYSEEFGYRALPGYTRGVPVLDEESPEECAEAHAQAQATHPGYPLKAHPVELDRPMSRSGNITRDPATRANERRADDRGRFVSVRKLHERRRRIRVPWMAAGVVVAVIALVWPRKAR